MICWYSYRSYADGFCGEYQCDCADLKKFIRNRYNDISCMYVRLQDGRKYIAYRGFGHWKKQNGNLVWEKNINPKKLIWDPLGSYEKKLIKHLKDKVAH